MINIILNGCCGKMGKVVANNIRAFKNLSIAAGIDKFGENSNTFPVYKSLKECNVQCDVVLDFSRPDSLDDILDYCKDKKLPAVLCTTGYTEDQLNKIKDYSNFFPIFKSANMSLGINILNNVLKSISAFLYNDFDIEIIEKHHNQKVDSPSGTALLLADTIKDAIHEETTFVNGRSGISKRKHNDIGIHAVRGGSIVGEHEIIFAGQGETISLKHEALSRDVFAIGALKACSFITAKNSGMFNMDDLIKEAL